jgi:cysteine desulfurase
VRRIYLDHAATTPILPEVAEAMSPWITGGFGNPSSLHAEGREAKHAIDQAREILSNEWGCLFAEAIFTSGGTESANMAILGTALANPDPKRNRVIFSSVEHHCVLHTQPLLERLGVRVLLAPVNRQGSVDLNWLEDKVGEDTLLVSVMHANNELGTIQPIEAVGEIVKRAGTIFHCDAVQTFMGGPGGIHPTIDLLSVSAHKGNGPKATGALFVRAGTKLKPTALGGGQERELRAGTENVAGIVGFGAAIKAHRARPELAKAKQAARDAFKAELGPEVDWTLDSETPCLPGHAHLRAPGIEAETLLIALDQQGVSASSGAACSSGSLEPSHVLKACGYSDAECKEGVRFTFGWPNTPEEAREAAGILRDVIGRIRAARPSKV